MGLSLEEYASYTWFNYHLKCKGYKAKRLDSWKQTRQLAFITMMSSANADPRKTRNLTPEIWWPLEEIEQKKVRKIIPIWQRKDFKQIVERFNNIKR